MSINEWLLGVINTVCTKRNKVRLRLIPKVYRNHMCKRTTSPHVPANNEEWHGLCFEVENIGFFPATVVEAGFLVKNGKEGIAFGDVKLNDDGGTLPQRIEPQASIELFVPAAKGFLSRRLSKTTRAYVKTASGLHFTGTSAVFKELIHRGRMGGALNTTVPQGHRVTSQAKPANV